MSSLEPFLLEVIACPACKGLLQIGTTLDCLACGLSYPIVEGIPVLLVTDATPLASSDEAP